MLLFACTTTVVQTSTEPIPEFHGTPTKVAFLPIKANDSSSRNIVKLMTVRDLGLVFQTHPKYELMDMEEVAQVFKESGHKNVDDLDKEDMKALAESIGADLLIKTNMNSGSQGIFNVNSQFYSIRSDELKQHSYDVVTHKDLRYKMLQENLMPEIDSFVSSEVDKLLNSAIQNYVMDKNEEAVEGFKYVISLDPDKLDAYYYLGCAYQKMEDYVQAEEYLSQAVEIKPDDERCLLVLNDIYEATDQKVKRVALMEKIAAQREDEEIWLVVGNIYDELGNKTKAREAFEQSLSIDPDFTQTIIRYGFWLYEEEEYVAAIPMLEKAAELFPDNELVSDRLGASYFKANRIAEAITRYENIIANDANNMQALLTVAGLYRTQAGESSDSKVVADYNSKAIASLNKAKAVDPDNAMVYLNLAAIYFSQKKNNDAETNANLALAKNPSLYQPYLILSGVNQTKGADQYSRFIDLEKQAAKAVGRKADQLKKDREAAKASALNFLRTARTNLEAARSRTSDAQALRDINNRINGINNMINQVQ
jgi:tetratricopeptide (TPR) repeat protein